MSVVKSRRTPSRLEVIIQAKRIRDEIEKLCIRNLGLRDPEVIARKQFAIGKNLNFEPDRYILIIRTTKENLRLLGYEAQMYLVRANDIKYPIIRSELDQRRTSQDLAISTYNQIIQEFQHIIDVCNVDVNIYRQYVDMIDTEINLIKAWRKSDNKRFPKD